MFCAYCGSQSKLAGAFFCSTCGKPLARERDGDGLTGQTFVNDIQQSERKAGAGAALASQLNERLNSFGVWLRRRLGRFAQKSLSLATGRTLFVLNLILVVIVFFGSVWSQANDSTLYGVPALSTLLIPVWIATIGLLAYLVFMPRNWLSALQVLVWVYVARTLLVALWNLVAISTISSVQASPVQLLVVGFLTILVEPLLGLVLISPAIYVWIRTRKPAQSLPN